MDTPREYARSLLRKAREDQDVADRVAADDRGPACPGVWLLRGSGGAMLGSRRVDGPTTGHRGGVVALGGTDPEGAPQVNCRISVTSPSRPYRIAREGRSHGHSP